jgi:hypothetical protein
VNGIRSSKITGHTDFEFGVNVLNAFNQPNFIPVGQVGANASIVSALGTNVPGNYEVTQLAGQNTSRLVELVARFNW